jgi:hypothetical protein
MKAPVTGMWLLKHLGLDDAILGDLLEGYQSRRSPRWFWWQALRATVAALRQHAVLTIVAVALGWLVLAVFFKFAGVPARLDTYLNASGLVERYSAAWWLRSVSMWVVVGFPFVASGWIVATIASRCPLLPVFAFALSVSMVVLLALILDTGQGDGFDFRVWLTVPLFLMVAPATAVALGGFVAARR